MQVSFSKLTISVTVCGAMLAAETQTRGQDPSVVGQWGDVIIPDTNGEHMILLKNGKVLIFDAGFPTNCQFFLPEGHPENTCGADCFTDPFSGPTEANSGHHHMLACSGHAGLLDGRVLFVGSQSDFLETLEQTTILDPDQDCPDNCWEAQDDNPAHRFYPTCTTLWNGTILTMAGWEPLVFNGPEANTPNIFHPTALPGQQWTELEGAEYCDWGEDCPGPPEGPYNFHIPWYPFMFQLSTGPVIYSGRGNGPPVNLPGALFTRKLDTLLEVWEDLFEDPDPIPGGSAVMYGNDLIMKAGAGPPSQQGSPLVYKLDASSTSPQWVQLASMAHSRVFHYLVALADGKILAVGGEVGQGSILIPELYDPPSDTWAEMAPREDHMALHSSAVLLPDARVLTVGKAPKTAQVFSPPVSV